MQFFPEKAEIIVAALRNSIGGRALKSRRFLGSPLLRKIRYFELCRRKSPIYPTDISSFFNAIAYSALASSALRGYFFYPVIHGNGIYRIDREKTAALFSEICMSAAVRCGYVKMGTTGDYMYVRWKGKGLSKENMPLVRSVKAVYLELKKEDKYEVFIKSEAALYPETLYTYPIYRAAETAAIPLHGTDSLTAFDDCFGGTHTVDRRRHYTSGVPCTLSGRINSRKAYRLHIVAPQNTDRR